jgi:hypothetical protein
MVLKRFNMIELTNRINSNKAFFTNEEDSFVFMEEVEDPYNWR